jgi:hypothetical protein
VPLALFLKPLFPAERLAAQRPWVAAEGEAAQELAGGGKGKGWGCDEEACGAPMHAATTSLLLWQPLKVLPLKHPHRVSEDGKWRRKGCFSYSGKHRASTQKAVDLPMQPMSSLHSSSSSSSSTAQAGAASRGWLSNSQIKFRQDPHKVPSSSIINRQTPLRLESKI